MQSQTVDEIVVDCLSDLDDITDGDTQKLISCGRGVVTLLRDALRSVSETSMDPSTGRTTTGALHALANEHINSVYYRNVNPKWLQLYTDAAILGAILELSPSSSTNADPAGCLSIIRKLDMAVIVAGAPGKNRRARIHLLIRLAQQRLPSASGSPIIGRRTSKRARLSYDELLYAPEEIPTLSKAPSMHEFETSHSDSPFIIRGYVTGETPSDLDWPAMQRWTSGRYLLDVAGPGRVVPVEIGRAYDEEDWSQKILPFNEFLERAGFFGGNDKTTEAMYLAQYDVFGQMPELQRDICIPDYCWTRPDPTQHPGYIPPPDVQINVWVGSGSGEIVSPPHTDPYFNCFVQVVGHKRVWIAPPSATSGMMAYGVTAQGGSAIAKQYMDNTSELPILKQPAEETWSRYPEFRRDVVPLSREAVLAPGDMLFLPPGWWHAMSGVGYGPGWSVSMWF